MEKLFGRYIRKLDEPTSQSAVPESQRSKMDRFIISISLAQESDMRFSGELYDHASGCVHSEDMWVVESLCPVPLISGAIPDVTREHMMSLMRRLAGSTECFRIVCGMGSVEFGSIGTGPRMAYGSCGRIVSCVVEGAVLLPSKDSWGDESVCKFLNMHAGVGEQVSGRWFYRLKLT